MVRFEFENRLFKASEINSAEFSDRVYSSTPYVSMGSNCLSHIRKFHKSSVYSLGTGLDFGSYRDVCDIYDLFRGEMIFIENYYYRYKPLSKLSLLEINTVAATLNLGTIVKIAAPNEAGSNSITMPLFKGHFISVDNKNAVEQYLAQNIHDYINHEFVRQSTQVSSYFIHLFVILFDFY
jgi:hypothetical protein